MSVIEARVWIPKNKLGDFVEDMATKIPYVKVVGMNVAIPEEAKPPRKTTPLAITDQTVKLSNPQGKIYDAIKSGTVYEVDLAEKTGVLRVKRVLNCLIKKKLVKGRDGTYTVAG